MSVKLQPEQEETNVSHNDIFSTKLDQSLKDIIKNEGFLKYEIEIRNVSSNGSNYLSTLWEIDVKGITKNGDKEIHLFVKRIIDVGSFHASFELADLYNYEIFVYKELFKIFAKLQDDANVPKAERFKMLKTYDESITEAIIMENLSLSGFTTYHRMETMSLKFAERAVQDLARFHALSFVLREKNPKYFETKIKSIKYAVNFGDNWKKMVKNSWDISVNHVNDDLKDNVNKAFSDLAVKFAEYQNDKSIQDCLCHGDYKPSNIMVKINEGEIEETLPIDYQFIYYGCPVFDFLFLIYMSTDREFRKAHLTNLKDLYYDTLSNFLKYFDIDADKVYSRKEFDKVYKEKLDYGLMASLVFLPYLFAHEDQVPDLSKGEEQMTFQVVNGFEERLRGIIEDFEEWGYL